MEKLILLLHIFVASFSYADNKLDFSSFRFENDSFFRDDGLYSNGLIAAWGYDDVAHLDNKTLPDWLAYLAQKSYLMGRQGKHYDIAYTVAHLLQTPIDISTSQLVEEDAPYVGLMAWHGKLTAYDQNTIDRLSLTFGLVGPASGAEFVQKITHEVIAASEPHGWENQISNEFVFQLQAERNWRIYNKEFVSSEFDLVTGVDTGFGNYRSDIGVGLGVRWGQDLQNNFSSYSVFPIEKLNTAHNSDKGWYLFANTSSFYVANDIFMDGNTFQDSHRVDLIHLQYGASIGVMANIYNWNFVYSLVQLSDQYRGQNESSRFGSFTVTYLF